ncbi:hypothetical protein B0H10DRAFT_2196760 [Mycena sp. CBHHK59/15]|nr:hypothetical protein B0H10DRAFT_2196760 [Mycena sp. CBHHK59/15]
MWNKAMNYRPCRLPEAQQERNEKTGVVVVAVVVIVVVVVVVSGLLRSTFAKGAKRLSMLPPIGIRNPATRKQPTVLCFQTASRLASTATKEPTCSTAFGLSSLGPTQYFLSAMQKVVTPSESRRSPKMSTSQRPAPLLWPIQLASVARIRLTLSPVIHSLPLQPNSLCQWEAGMTV